MVWSMSVKTPDGAGLTGSEWFSYLEPTTFVLRICSPITARAPMPRDYAGGASVTVDELRVATVKGLVLPGGLTLGAGRSMVAALARIGVGEAIWSRKAGGETSLRRQFIQDNPWTLYL